MVAITDKIREEVGRYLGTDYTGYSDETYAFYYRCANADMHYADADRYAILNTMFNYDIGMDNARAIDGWMYEHDAEIYELMATNIEHKALVALAVVELGLDIDFGSWIKEDYTEYKFFEN